MKKASVTTKSIENLRSVSFVAMTDGFKSFMCYVGLVGHRKLL